MADKASGGITAKILHDEVKVRLKGELNYEPADSTEKWVYKKHSVPASPDVIFSNSGGDEFYGEANSAVADTDAVLWIAVKHSGTSDGSTATTEAIMINFSGTDPVWNGTDGSSNNNMIIGPNELFVFRGNGTLIADIKVGTVKLAANKASAIGTGTVEAYVAVVVDDL